MIYPWISLRKPPAISSPQLAKRRRAMEKEKADEDAAKVGLGVPESLAEGNTYTDLNRNSRQTSNPDFCWDGFSQADSLKG